MKNKEKWDGELNHLSCYLHTWPYPTHPHPPPPPHMYALCVYGAVNTQGIVWTILCPYINFSFIHSFIHQPPLPPPPTPPPAASTYGDRATASVHKRTLQHAARAQRLVMVRYQTGPVTVEHYSLPILLQANVFLCVWNLKRDTERELELELENFILQGL